MGNGYIIPCPILAVVESDAHLHLTSVKFIGMTLYFFFENGDLPMTTHVHLSPPMSTHVYLSPHMYTHMTHMPNYVHCGTH